MRAKDLLESKTKVIISPNVSETMPKTISVPDMDQYYEYYRFLIAVAGHPEKDIPLDGPVSDGTYIAPYSKQELDHVLKILKKMNLSPKFITKYDSREPEHVNKFSPVRKFVDYQ